MDYQKSSISQIKVYSLVCFAVIILYLPFYVNAQQTYFSIQSVTVTAVVPEPVIHNPPSSGGGGGGGGATAVDDKTVTFSGTALKGGIVTILLNSIIIADTPVNPDGTFKISLSGIPSGTQNFGFKVQDSKGQVSSIQTFTIKITKGVTTIVNGISLPQYLNSQIDTSVIEHYDLSSDNKIDIVDMSILAYWYGRSDAPAKVDFNHDKKIDLVDFSIMAYYWTG